MGQLHIIIVATHKVLSGLNITIQMCPRRETGNHELPGFSKFSADVTAKFKVPEMGYDYLDMVSSGVCSSSGP